MKKLLWICTLLLLVACDSGTDDNGGWLPRKHKTPKTAPSAAANPEHTETVTMLATRWHDCHMQRSTHCLEDLPDADIIYYQKKLSREAYLQQKENLFNLYPDFYLDPNIGVSVTQQDKSHVVARLVKRVKDMQNGVKDHTLELVFLMPQQLLVEERGDDLVWKDNAALPPYEAENDTEKNQ